ALGRDRPAARGCGIRVAHAGVMRDAPHLVRLSVPDIEIWKERSVTDGSQSPEEHAPIAQKPWRLERWSARRLQGREGAFRRRVDRSRWNVGRIARHENRVAPPATSIGFRRGAPHDDAGWHARRPKTDRARPP